MTQKHTGWVVLAGAIFMLLTSMSGDVAELENWGGMMNPAFVGRMLLHIGSVGGAWFAGKLMPQMGTPPEPEMPSIQRCPACGR